MSFVRIQEFYESPEFKGRHFSLEEYIDWWSLNMSKVKGTFDYPERWNGFNVPGKEILDWLFECDEEILRDKELDLIRRLAKKLNIDIGETKQGWGLYLLLREELKSIYLIGCHRQNGDKYIKEVISHEVAHALYFLYPEYKESVQNLLAELDKDIDGKLTKKCAVDWLIKRGYDESVIDDEIQAYFSTGDELGIMSDFVDNFNEFRKKTKK